MQKVFWTQGAQSLLHRCNPILHRCKSSFGWCKRLFGDLCSLGPKDLLLPPLSTFGIFRVFGLHRGVFFGCGFFAYSWKLPAYGGAFLLTVDNFSFFTYSWSFLACSFSFLTYSWSFFAYSGKVYLIRALRDCKQRSLTVSKKAPTVSKKASPVFLHDWGFFAYNVTARPGTQRTVSKTTQL